MFERKLERNFVKILSVVGARPQFIKAAPVSRELRKKQTEILVHTGQHYDYQMSEVFFRELNIPAPDINLEVGSGSHGHQTGQMMSRLEDVVLQEKPDWVLVYGDTNSTLAGALVAAKLNIPVAHVEAGLRSFNKSMPEEINRILTDHVSDLLFTPTDTASRNLEREGVSHGVHQVGDVMYDVMLHHLKIAEGKSSTLTRFSLKPRGYLLSTIHRPSNTDDKDRLEMILSAFCQTEETVILLLHPRTRDRIKEYCLEAMISHAPNLRVMEPASYLDMLILEKNARVILTDSGGVQKEAYFAKVPCITLRSETEWIETVETGWNTLAGANLDRIPELVRDTKDGSSSCPNFYGDGTAAKQIAQLLDLQQRDK